MYLVLGRDKASVLKIHSDSSKTFCETDIVKMLAILIDNIFFTFDGRVYNQTIAIPIGTNCTPLIADVIVFSRGRLHTGTS